jgi:hypothetical protein
MNWTTSTQRMKEKRRPPLVEQLYIAILIGSLIGMALQARSAEEDPHSPAQADSSPRRLKPALQLNDAAAGGDRHRLRAVTGT